MKIFDNLRGRAAIQGTADRFGQSPEDVRQAETGKPVATSQNAESFRRLVTDILTNATRLPDRPKKKEG